MNTRQTGMENGRQMRITPEEIEIIKNTFGNNERLLKLMRKMFLPELDPNAPVGQLIDLYLTLNTDGMTPEDVYINLKARNQLVAHVDQVLMQFLLISQQPTNSEVVAKVGKNSAK